jgi:hypothetical protein
MIINILLKPEILKYRFPIEAKVTFSILESNDRTKKYSVTSKHFFNVTDKNEESIGMGRININIKVVLFLFLKVFVIGVLNLFGSKVPLQQKKNFTVPQIFF